MPGGAGASGDPRKEKIPARLVTRNIWRERFEDIFSFERYLARNGTIILTFFSSTYRRKSNASVFSRDWMSLQRTGSFPWPISPSAHCGKYQAAYQEVIRHTSSEAAPWHVVPADHKWFARVVIGSTVVSALEGLDLQFPKVEPASLQEFKLVRKALLAEGQERKRR